MVAHRVVVYLRGGNCMNGYCTSHDNACLFISDWVKQRLEKNVDYIITLQDAESRPVFACVASEIVGMYLPDDTVLTPPPQTQTQERIAKAFETLVKVAEKDANSGDDWKGEGS